MQKVQVKSPKGVNVMMVLPPTRNFVMYRQLSNPQISPLIEQSGTAPSNGSDDIQGDVLDLKGWKRSSL